MDVGVDRIVVELWALSRVQGAQHFNCQRCMVRAQWHSLGEKRTKTLGRDALPNNLHASMQKTLNARAKPSKYASSSKP